MRLPTLQTLPGIAMRAVLRMLLSRLPRALIRLQYWLDCRGLPTGTERMRRLPYATLTSCSSILEATDSDGRAAEYERAAKGDVR